MCIHPLDLSSHVQEIKRRILYAMIKLDRDVKLATEDFCNTFFDEKGKSEMGIKKQGRTTDEIGPKRRLRNSMSQKARTRRPRKPRARDWSADPSQRRRRCGAIGRARKPSCQASLAKFSNICQHFVTNLAYLARFRLYQDRFF